MKEEELEFISVNAEDDDDFNNINQAYADQSGSNGGGDSVIGSWIFKQSKHPFAILFHLLFKSLALFIYVFGNWITSNFIFIFVICIVLLAFDFWTVKNVSGRLLVGLRWWSYVKEDGSNEWTFESLEDMTEISTVDSRIFWGALYLNPLCWAVLFLIDLIKFEFEYLPVVIAALLMNTANTIGYIKCSSSAKNRMQSLVEAGMRQGSMAALENSSVRNWVLSSLLAVTSNQTPETKANV
eukprot:gene4988-6973_t